MDAFDLPIDSLRDVIAGLIADEHSFRSSRLTKEKSLVGVDGQRGRHDEALVMSNELRKACADRVANFFGIPVAILPTKGDLLVTEWAQAVQTAVRQSLTYLTFVAAARGEDRISASHAAADVFAESAAVSGLMYGRKRLLSFVSPHGYLSFVLTIIAPMLQGVTRLDARQMIPESLMETLEFGDLVVATPSLWRYLIDEGAAAPENVMALYFGEAMNPELAQMMRTRGFNAQREIYGATETGLIGWRDTQHEPFRLFDSLKRDEEFFQRTLASGETVNIEPPDTIEWDGPRTFQVGSRRDGAVQIGAVNVFPERISAVIESHDDVESCTVEIGRHSGGFDRLIARIVLKDPSSLGENEARSIERVCREKLMPHERPRIYRFEQSSK